MKKRVLALLLAATMVFGLAACGGSDSGDTADNATVTDDAGTDDAADAEDTDAAQTDDAADTETEADTCFHRREDFIRTGRTESRDD